MKAKTAKVSQPLCECCGEPRVTRPGRRFVVGGRVFVGRVCDACVTCEVCGERLRITDDAEISCGCAEFD